MSKINAPVLALFALFHSAALHADQYAFLVGVKDYSLSGELKSLQFSESDMRTLYDTLIQSGVPKDNLVLMTQKMSAESARLAPRSERIRKELDLLLSELDEDDSVIVAFAGHGVQFAGDSVNYFCPVNAELTDKSTLVSLSKIYERLDRCRANRKLMLVDACRNDPLSGDSKSPRRIQLESVVDRAPPVLSGGTIALFSCSPSEASYEDAKLQGGIFFHFVNRSFAGEADVDEDGVVDLIELEHFTVKSTKKWARVNLGKKQTPERRGNAVGAMPLVNVGRGVAMASPVSPRSADAPATFTNSINLKMIRVQPGSMMMGAVRSNRGMDFNTPPHKVMISKPFYLGATEITQRQWMTVMDTAPWEDQRYSKSMPDAPATHVTWEDAVEFCIRLSAKENRRYSLPSEAQWELACRAGTKTTCHFGELDFSALSEHGWFEKNAALAGERYPHLVGQKRPNPLGFFDMHGNVWEWCADWYHDRYGREPIVLDPVGPPTGSRRVTRGGGWNDPATKLKSSTRSGEDPTNFRSSGIGFRVLAESFK